LGAEPFESSAMKKPTTFAALAKSSRSFAMLRTLNFAPICASRLFPRYQVSQSSSKAIGAKFESSQSIDHFLSKPTWSIESLLPANEDTTAFQTEPPITPKQLRHLLRLSALPEPKDDHEEASMLKTLSSQLHFLSAVRGVDTSGVTPLRALRDETVTAEREQEITVEKLRDHLAKEQVVGEWYVRVRRRKDELVEDRVTPKDWKPLEQAERASGKFFAVDGAKGEGEEVVIKES
jgi:Asp-tRNA(Asn)/Glu-tRNA(Gln) amidotransferase C subunit